jgi:hypothetical protein
LPNMLLSIEKLFVITFIRSRHCGVINRIEPTD